MEVGSIILAILFAFGGTYLYESIVYLVSPSPNILLQILALVITGAVIFGMFWLFDKLGF